MQQPGDSESLREERDTPTGALAERRWRTLLDESPFGIVTYRPDGSVTSGNRSLQSLFGLTDEEQDLVAGTYNVLEDAQLDSLGVGKLIRRAFEGESIRIPAFEYEMETPIRKRLVRRWMEGVFYPVRDDDGRVLEVVSIQYDVTDQKETHQELLSSEEALRDRLRELEQLYATAPAGLCLVDTDLRFVRINETMAAIQGLPIEDHIGRTLREILPNVANEVEPILRRVLRTGEASMGFEIQGEAFAQPGMPRDWLASYYPLKDEGGAVIGVSAVVQETTEKKRAEAALQDSRRRLHAVIDNAEIVLWAIDEKGVFTLSVGKGLKALGLRPGEVLGLSVYDIYGDSEPTVDAHRRALSGEPVSYVARVADFAFDCRVLPAFDSQGRVRGATGVAFDITENLRAEDERIRFEAKLQHAQKLESLGVLAGGIAHDFNNLLMGMLGNADLALLRLAPESPGVRHVKQIKSAAERASDLTNQMLAYSGKGRFVVEPIDLNRLVKEMGHLLQAVISKKADLRLELATDLPAINADAGQIHQVVMNMITNASEAFGDDKGTVRVVTRVVEMDESDLSEGVLGEGLSPGSYASLEVSDSGCGMDLNTLGKIFDPFYTTKFTGRGLGLAAVMGIVRGHEAALKVRSEVGVGSAFTVLFPVLSTSLDPAVEPGGEVAGEGAREGAGVGILVVDDEEIVRDVARSMLESEGFEVFVAWDGQEGVDIYRRCADEIALVLLDMTMPRLDGEEALKELQKIRPDVRVILTSGYSEQVATDRFGGKDLAGFLQKPFGLKRLTSAIRVAIS